MWGATAYGYDYNSNDGFQSTLPVWGATAYGYDYNSNDGFQSTLPVWGATSIQRSVRKDALISIHAPRVGSDSCNGGRDFAAVLISIHAPRVGSDRLPRYTGGSV